ncbi:MAG: Rnase Y domain-containing protein, partial [Candidatus Goldiibacteriota bacterium]
MVITIIAAFAALAVGAGLGFLMRKFISEQQITSAKAYSAQIIETAKKDAATVKKEAELEIRDK